MDHACDWCQKGSLELDKTYVVCLVEEHENGLVRIGSRCNGHLGSDADDLVEVYNPMIRLSLLDYPTTDEYGLPIEALTVRGDNDVPFLSRFEWNAGVATGTRMCTYF